MDKLYIKGSEETPEILLDMENSIFSISGMSLPEDVKGFYKPILNWLKDYFTAPNFSTVFTFKMTYFNTASAKVILDILNLLKKASNQGYNVEVIWTYDQEDKEMLETGKYYTDIVAIQMTYKETSLFE